MREAGPAVNAFFTCSQLQCKTIIPRPCEASKLLRPEPESSPSNEAIQIHGMTAHPNVVVFHALVCECTARPRADQASQHRSELSPPLACV